MRREQPVDPAGTVSQFVPEQPAPDLGLPTAPCGVEVLPVSYNALYTWEYTVQRPELRNLYEKSKDMMWNARTLLAWDTDVDPEAPTVPDQFCPIFGTSLWDKLTPAELKTLRRLSFSYILSNFLHCEHGARLSTTQIG